MPIPVDVVTRVQSAISLGRCAEAQLILHQFFPGLKRSSQLIDALGNVADAAEFRHDFLRAELYYSLAISLYEKCLPRMHGDGLHCLRRLAEMFRRQNKDEDLDNLLNRAEALLVRLAQEHFERT
jgi:hypothetical protein